MNLSAAISGSGSTEMAAAHPLPIAHGTEAARPGQSSPLPCPRAHHNPGVPHQWIPHQRKASALQGTTRRRPMWCSTRSHQIAACGSWFARDPHAVSRAEFPIRGGKIGSAISCSRQSPCRSITGSPGTPTKIPVLTMTCGSSRWLSAVLVPTRGAEDLFARWWHLIDHSVRCPGCWFGTAKARSGGGRHRKPGLTQDCRASAAPSARMSSSVSPPTPKRKASSNATTPRKPRSCPAGRSPGRTTSTGYSRRGWRWRRPAANRSWAAHRRTGSTPTGTRCSRCHPVPPVIGWQQSTRLARDHYIRLDSNDYSVHPSVIGRRIEVTADGRRRRPPSGAAG